MSLQDLQEIFDCDKEFTKFSDVEMVYGQVRLALEEEAIALRDVMDGVVSKFD